MRRPFFALAMLVCCSTAAAHSFDPVVVDVRETSAGVFALRWQTSPGTEGAMPSGVWLQWPAHCRVIAATDERPTKIDCGESGLRGETLALPVAVAARSDVLLRLRWQDGEAFSTVLSRAAPIFVVPAGNGSRATPVAIMRGYIWLGIEHILLGADHLLFVLCLMLLAPQTRRLLYTLTAFTLAHSLTLALSILDVVHVPPAPVEASIALSIVLLAGELTRDPTGSPTLARRAPWVVAFAFGLLHGLGFAGALRQIGLPAQQLPLALVAFNLGVEAGQLLFVGSAWLPVALWRRATRAQALLRLLPAYAIGAVAVAWVLQRLDFLGL